MQLVVAQHGRSAPCGAALDPLFAVHRHMFTPSSPRRGIDAYPFLLQLDSIEIGASDDSCYFKYLDATTADVYTSRSTPVYKSDTVLRWRLEYPEVSSSCWCLCPYNTSVNLALTAKFVAKGPNGPLD